MATDSVDVIIPFLKPDQLVIDCICSLNKNNNVGKFYLVQNGVEDAKAGEEKKKLIKILEVIPKNEEIMHLIVEKKQTSCALNHGLRVSNARYVLFASSHSHFEKGYIDRLYNEMEKNEKIYAIGGRVVCVPGSGDQIANAVRDAFSSYLASFSKYRTLKKQEKYIHSKKLYGTIYRKSAMDKIDLFNEEKERTQDIDVISRLVQSGGDSIIFPVKNVYWILTAKTPFDLYRRYFNQGYWTVKYNANNRNYFIVLACVLLFIFFAFIKGISMTYFALGIFLFIVIYSFKISKRKPNTLVVATSLFLIYAGYFMGIFKSIIILCIDLLKKLTR